MPTEYDIAPDELDDSVQTMLTYGEFSQLRDAEIRLKVCLLIKTDKDGEPVASKGDAVVLKKVPPFLSPICTPHFVVLIDNYALANFPQRIDAAIHKALSRVEAKVTETGIKWATKSPDVQEFTATIRRFGLHNDLLRDLMAAADEFASVVQSATNSDPVAN